MMDNLECAICFEIFTEPTSLLCGHTFCINCLKDLITCPTCRTLITKPLSVNIILRNIVDKMEKTLKFPTEIYGGFRKIESTCFRADDIVCSNPVLKQLLIEHEIVNIRNTFSRLPLILTYISYIKNILIFDIKNYLPADGIQPHGGLMHYPTQITQQQSYVNNDVFIVIYYYEICDYYVQYSYKQKIYDRNSQHVSDEPHKQISINLRNAQSSKYGPKEIFGDIYKKRPTLTFL